MTDTQVIEADVVEENAVEVYRPPAATPSLFRTDDPVEVIEKATAVADALKRVVADRGLISTISGREHPRVEAWQTLGSMLGVFPVKEWVRAIPWPEQIPEALKSHHARGLAFGFEASFFAQRADGAIVGGGEAACMRSEKTWATRDDYALRSMAQTRATSKALKGPLGFVMSLAGYDTTPAEEMGDTAPTQDAGHPFGLPYDKETGRQVGDACVALCGGDKKKGTQLWKSITAECGGYMPQAAAVALLKAANAEMMFPDVQAPELT